MGLVVDGQPALAGRVDVGEGPIGELLALLGRQPCHPADDKRARPRYQVSTKRCRAPARASAGGAAQRRRDQRARLGRVDHVVELEQRRRVERLRVALRRPPSARGRAARARPRRRSPRAPCAVAEPDRALEPHRAEVGRRPGDGQERLVQAAADHRLGAEAVAAAQDHRDERHAQRARPATSSRDAWRTSPVASAFGPDHDTRACRRARRSAARRRRRAAGSAPPCRRASLVIAPAMWRVSLAMIPSGRPSIRASAVHHLRREALAQERHRALVGERLDDRRDRVGAPRALGHEVAQAGLVGRGARRRRALEVAEQPLRRPPSPRASSATDDVDDAVARLHRRSGRPRRGRRRPRPPPSIIAGPPMPSEVFSVATIRSEQPAITALPAKQRPATTAIRGTTPESRPRARTRACRAPRRPGSRCRPGRPPPPSAKNTVGSRMRSISSNRRSFLRCPSAPWVPASTV